MMLVYHVVLVMGRQLELGDENARTCMVNVKDINITYIVD